MTLKAALAAETLSTGGGCPCGGADLRCECGSMLARIVETGVELKCRRCKRTWVVPLDKRQRGESEGWRLKSDC